MIVAEYRVVLPASTSVHDEAILIVPVGSVAMVAAVRLRTLLSWLTRIDKLRKPEISL
jgi:hypothetical protein